MTIHVNGYTVHGNNEAEFTSRSRKRHVERGQDASHAQGAILNTARFARVVGCRLGALSPVVRGVIRFSRTTREAQSTDNRQRARSAQCMSWKKWAF
jgi:hypothetical protein